MSDFVSVLLERDFFVLISRERSHVLERFAFAKANAATWGSFVNLLGVSAATFVSVFTQSEVPPPHEEDRLEDLSDLYIFSDPDFPFLQCAEETFTTYEWLFPQIAGSKRIRTEYGQYFDVYPSHMLAAVREHLNKKGYSLEPM